MFGHVINVATAVAGLLQAAIVLVFFGTLVMVVLASFSVVPMPY